MSYDSVVIFRPSAEVRTGDQSGHCLLIAFKVGFGFTRLRKSVFLDNGSTVHQIVIEMKASTATAAV